MLNTKKLGVWVVAALSLAGAQCALGNNGNGNGNGNGVAHGNLPNGRPFQILQNAIANEDAMLQAQIAALQGELDANAANDDALGQMIGALQFTVANLEQRMTAAEGNLQALDDWETAQDALLSYEMQQITFLQGQVANAQNNINDLFGLYGVEQSAVVGLGHEIDVLTAQGNAQAGEIAGLQSQFQALNTEYQGTRAALAAGCPAGSAIRQVIAGGPMTCQPVSGVAATVQVAFTVDGPGVGTQSATCPPDMVATGGGVGSNPGLTILQSLPTANGWTASLLNAVPFTSTPAAVAVRCIGQ